MINLESPIIYTTSLPLINSSELGIKLNMLFKLVTIKIKNKVPIRI